MKDTRPAAVILDSFALREGDLDWRALEQCVRVTARYPRTAYEDIAPRLAGADIAIVNKARIDEAVLCACPRLSFVCVTATGTDSLDIEACRRHGVPVANVPGYSTRSVAQHTLALLLALCGCPGRYDAALRAGHWQLDLPQDGSLFAQRELFEKTLGVVGYGAIGAQVAALGCALGMRVLCATRTPRRDENGVRFVPLLTLLAESDAITLHCPARPETLRLLNEETLALCRPGVLVVNTARGALVDEPAMAKALCAGRVGGFAADVAAAEPLSPESPLLCAPHTLFTPHIAWASPEALARLCAAVAENVEAFLRGQPKNLVNGAS